MCGIVGIFNIQEQTPELRQKALRMSQKIRHRGPDWSGIYTGPTAILCHERLSIVDPESGRQPLFAPDKKQVLAVNGEIYNHKDIRSLSPDPSPVGRGEATPSGGMQPYVYQTGSDCEVILALYRDWKSKGYPMSHSSLPTGEGRGEAFPSFLERLSGIFAFALYDVEDGSFLIARDPIGVIPLYIGYDKDGKVYVASELKALEGQCDRYEPFLPGHYYWSKEADKGMQRWYSREWMAGKTRPKSELSYGQAVEEIRQSLMGAVKRQLMSDVPYGVLLSGGLDSSVISAIAARYASHRVENGGTSPAWWPRLHSFAVGLKGAP